MLVNDVESAPAAKTLIITHLDDQTSKNCSEMNILPMTYAADSLVKNIDKPAPSYLNAFDRPAGALVDQLHILRSEKSKM